MRIKKLIPEDVKRVQEPSEVMMTREQWEEAQKKIDEVNSKIDYYAQLHDAHPGGHNQEWKPREETSHSRRPRADMIEGQGNFKDCKESEQQLQHHDTDVADKR